MPFLAVLVEETTTTEGTGTVSLAGASTNKRTFVTAFGTGNQCLYTILDGLGSWEYGLGTITDATPDTLSRDQVLGSSAGGAKLSLGAGTKLVYCEVTPDNGINKGIQTFVDGDTTPSVKNGRVFVSSPTASTTMTGFDDGIPGQEIIIVCTNGNSVFQQTSVIKNPAALDLTSTANDVFTYVRGHASSNVWQLLSASVNG